MSVVCLLTSGALMGLLLTGCGLSLTPQPVPAVPLSAYGLRPAPSWVGARMTREAPDLYFDLNSHVLRTRKRKRLDQIAPPLQEMFTSRRNSSSSSRGTAMTGACTSTTSNWDWSALMRFGVFF